MKTTTSPHSPQICCQTTLLQETQLPLTNRAMCLEVSQGHQNMVPFHLLGMLSY